MIKRIKFTDHKGYYMDIVVEISETDNQTIEVTRLHDGQKFPVDVKDLITITDAKIEPKKEETNTK